MVDGADAGGIQSPQLGVAAHDLRVVVGVVRRGRSDGDQRVEVGRATDAGEISLALEVVGEGDGVGRGVLGAQGEDCAPDGLVGGPVEVARVQRAPDLIHRLVLQHARAEDCLFCVDVVRRFPGGGVDERGVGLRRAVFPSPVVG